MPGNKGPVLFGPAARSLLGASEASNAHGAGEKHEFIVELKLPNICQDESSNPHRRNTLGAFITARMNLYAVLSVAPEADEAEIKAAFRQLAKTFHPDVSGGDRWSEQQFKAILHAYRILEDPKKRSVYDAELANERSRARRRLKFGLATVAATFLVTVGAGAMIVWLGLGPEVFLWREAARAGHYCSDATACVGHEPEAPSGRAGIAGDRAEACRSGSETVTRATQGTCPPHRCEHVLDGR